MWYFWVKCLSTSHYSFFSFQLIWYQNLTNSTNSHFSICHTVQPLFSLLLLQWPLALHMPAHVPSDSVSASNKCPSFTVCWLIYTNYTSLCSREDDQIVWDESIKSLLSQAIISRYLAAVITSGAGWGRGGGAEKWVCFLKTHHTHTQTHTRTRRDMACSYPDQEPPPSQTQQPPPQLLQSQYLNEEYW